MGMRGPAGKPTALRLLEGNPSGRPINTNEPKPEIPKSVEPPEDLPERGKAIWNDLSSEMIRIGLLTKIDLHAFHRYIKFLLEYMEADEKLGKNYVLTIYHQGTKEPKYFMTNPFHSIRNKAAEHLNRLEQQLGLTPSARARMIGLAQGGSKGSDEPEDPYGS